MSNVFLSREKDLSLERVLMKILYLCLPDLSSNESSFPFGCLFICSMPRTLSAGKLSHMLLKAAYGTELFEMGSDDSLNSEKSMEATGKHRGTGPTGPDRFLREMF